MEAITRDILFGTGRSGQELGGTFAPRGWGGASPDGGSILSTFKGFGPDGTGRDRGLALMERFGMISAEQRAAGGSVAAAAEGAVDTARVLGFADDAAATAAGAASSIGSGQVGGAASRYANPVYGGLYAQTLMAQTGFVPPSAAPDGLVSIADDGASNVLRVADEIADDVVALERSLVGSFERLAAVPAEQKLPTLARALDATAAAGHGDDAFAVLSRSLADRPLAQAATALDVAVDDVLRAAPIADDVAKVAKVAAPIADDIAKVAASAAPKVGSAAASLLGSGSATRALLGASDDVLRGVMPFAAGVDDTLRLLARL
jgi:hypothetical protein